MKKQSILTPSLIGLLALALLLGCDKKKEDPKPGTGTTPPPTTVALAVTNVNPASGGEGTKVVITGTGFSATSASNKVKFGATEAVLDSATATRLVTKVPKGATTGKVTVEVGGKTASSSADFTVSAATTPAAFSTDNTSSDITAETAKVSSTLTANGGAAITQYGHVWSDTKTEPTTADTKTELGKTDGPFPLKITSELKGLKANTTYNVRAYATNDKGTSYGAAAQVKTAVLPITSQVNGTVLVGISAAGADLSDDKFYALDLETGTIKWSFKSGRGYSATVATANGIAYVASGKNLYAIDIATGMAKWSYAATTTGAFDTPIVDGGVVYLVEKQSNNLLLAIDAALGAKKWELSLGLGSATSCPTVVDGVVYESAGSKVFAVDAKGGTLKWSYATGSTVASNPSVVDKVVYIGSTDGFAYAIDASTGSRKWFAKLGDWGGSPTVAGGIVYIHSYNGYLYAFDAASGTKKWEYQTKIKSFVAPFLADGLVYAGSVAVDATTGVKKLDFVSGTNNPIVVSGIYYVPSASGLELSAINVTNGGQRWQSPRLSGYPLAPVIIGKDGKVHYPSTSGGQQ